MNAFSCLGSAPDGVDDESATPTRLTAIATTAMVTRAALDLSRYLDMCRVVLPWDAIVSAPTHGGRARVRPCTSGTMTSPSYGDVASAVRGRGMKVNCSGGPRMFTFRQPKR